jgi:hypothetical protein
MVIGRIGGTGRKGRKGRNAGMRRKGGKDGMLTKHRIGGTIGTRWTEFSAHPAV